jgi:hypothetical protein
MSVQKKQTSRLDPDQTNIVLSLVIYRVQDVKSGYSGSMVRELQIRPFYVFFVAIRQFQFFSQMQFELFVSDVIL